MEQKIRDYHMESFRILAMFMVIIYHSIIHSGLIKSTILSGVNFGVEFLHYLVSISNNCFLLLSGYYMINSKFRLKKILLLWGKTLFYSIVIYFIYFLTKGDTNYIYQSFFPILSGHYWFISAYIVLYFLTPILNLLVTKMSKEQFRYLLIILTIFYGIVTLIFRPTNLEKFQYVTYIYLIGAYLRLHVTQKEGKKHYLLQYFLIILGITALNYFTKLLMFCLVDSAGDDLFRLIYHFKEGLGVFVNPFLVIASISLFMKFKTLEIKNESLKKKITFVSTSVFSIYLIHENTKNVEYLWKNAFHLIEYNNSYSILIRILAISAIIFLVSLLIDVIRREIYKVIKKIPFIKKIIDRINQQIDKINLKIQKIFNENKLQKNSL